MSEEDVLAEIRRSAGLGQLPPRLRCVWVCVWLSVCLYIYVSQRARQLLAVFTTTLRWLEPASAIFREEEEEEDDDEGRVVEEEERTVALARLSLSCYRRSSVAYVCVYIHIGMQPIARVQCDDGQDACDTTRAALDYPSICATRAHSRRA